MSFINMLTNFLGGANSTNSAGSNSGVSAQAQAHALSNQAPAESSSVTTDANRANAAMLAQAQQASQAPQVAQGPQEIIVNQIKNLFKELDPMTALDLLMKLMAPFMGMLGMGPAPAAEKPAQAQLGPGQAPQAQLPAQALDQLMAQLGPGQAPAKVTSNEGFEAMLEDLAKQTSLNSTPTAQASSQQQQPVHLASQTPPAPAPTQAPTVAA